MTLGKSPTSEDAFRSGTGFCRDRVSETSIYGLLYRESHRLLPSRSTRAAATKPSSTARLNTPENRITFTS
jgi:hypothetical protein